MISLEQCRQIEPDLEKLSDEEVTKVRNLLYGLGELVFETWDDKRNDSKKQRGLLTSSTEVK
jgi:hypothetical protein